MKGCNGSMNTPESAWYAARIEGQRGMSWVYMSSFRLSIDQLRYRCMVGYLTQCSHQHKLAHRWYHLRRWPEGNYDSGPLLFCLKAGC